MTTSILPARTLVACAMLAMGATALHGQVGAGPGRIEVVVRDDSGRAVVGAMVWLAPAGRVAAADSGGSAVFDHVSAGPYTVETRRLGHAPASARGILPDGGRVEHVLVLRALGHLLPEVVVAGREGLLQRILERRAKGLGAVQFTEDLVPYRGMTADDLLRFNGRLSARLAAPARCGRPVVYVDGHRTPPPSWEKMDPPPPLGDFVRVGDIVAVEAHTSADHLREPFLYDDPEAFSPAARQAGPIVFGTTMNPGAVPLSGTCRRIVMIWTRFYDGR
ncbi:MAG: carboxypeptidase-like regulatory domain-containing protein [Gemmatimonadaceae bacterium]